MNPEESKEQSPAQTPSQDQSPAPATSQETGTKKSPSRSRPVTVYLSVLFAAALLLLVMSFFIQQRSHQALENLNETVTANQDRNALKLELQQAEFALQQAENDLEDAKKQVKHLEKQAEALEWLRQMEAAVRTSYREAKDLVDQFEAADLAEYLPTDPLLEDGESPAEVYRDIYAMFH